MGQTKEPGAYLKSGIKVADEVFIATALLHREHPGQKDFTVREIVERARRENLYGEMRPGVQIHAFLHCVANRPPNSVRVRTLFATDKGHRRLLLSGDEVHPERTGKIWPDPAEVPARYAELIEWAKQRYGTDKRSSPRWLDGVFQLIGLGQEVWRGEDPDEYIRGLREGWE
jgi:hypothetical protein